MRVYSGTIRLNGDLRWQVYKERMTAPEVMLLRSLHGPDSVVDLKYIADLKPEDVANERARLEQEYWINPDKEVSPVRKLFGQEHMPLPLHAPNAPDKKVAAEPVEAARGDKKSKLDDLAA